MPYTADEMQEYARLHRCSVPELRQRLVVNYGRSYYFFVGGTYTAPVEVNAEIVGKDALAALEPFGIACYKSTRSGEPKLKTAAELCHDYGTVAENMSVDFSATYSYYDADTKTFHHAACPIRSTVRAERVPEIEQWLSIINSEPLLDWLAYLPNLMRPAKALYLWGDPGTGKSFLPLLASRLWSTMGPTPGEGLLADFNDSVARCPLIFCDEQLPVDFRGRRGTERFRREIQSTVRAFHAKYQKSATLNGALRFIVSANHAHLIETDDTLTQADSEGIRQRIEVVKLPVASRDFLLRLGRERTERWLTDDLFAKHVLYLRDTRDLSLGRFGPERAEVSEASRRVHAELRFSGMASHFMRWLYLAFTGAIPPPAGSVMWVRLEGRPALIVNLDEMHSSWSSVLGLDAPPLKHSNVLRDAVRPMSQGRCRARLPNGQRRRFWIVDLQAFDEWLDVSESDKEFFAERARAHLAKDLQEVVREVDEPEGGAV
jgi:hypothetical protein